MASLEESEQFGTTERAAEEEEEEREVGVKMQVKQTSKQLLHRADNTFGSPKTKKS